MAGICIVFAGVVLYKVVFHMEKEMRLEEARIVEKNSQENADKHLMAERGFADEETQEESYEMVGHSPSRDYRDGRPTRRGRDISSDDDSSSDIGSPSDRSIV